MKLDLYQTLLQVESICRKTGKEIIKAKEAGFTIFTKSPNNLVTEIDESAERSLVKSLGELLPSSGFIAEEGTGKANKEGFNWIIDPIDGTTNFVHNIPIFCISVALHHTDLGLVLGVVYDPLRLESFSAYKGGGFFINQEEYIQNKQLKISDALLATGFPYDDFKHQDQYFSALKSLTHKTRGLRRMGSAAIDLAYVAAGRFGAFFEYGLNPWDVAAGILLVQEAGGLCSDFNGGNSMLFGEEILAAHASIQPEMLACLKKHFNSPL